HIVPGERRVLRAAIHVSAGDGTPERATIFGDWIDQRAALAARRVHREIVRTFAAAPTIVAAEHDLVHFLEAALADIGDPKLAARAIEAPAPRISESVRVDLRA